MNALLWTLQIVLAVLYVSGGAYKTFSFDELAAQLTALPRAGWTVVGVFEMVGGILLLVPAAARWAAVALALETFALSALYARYSLAVAVTNPLVWSVVMAVLVTFVAYRRSILKPPA